MNLHNINERQQSTRRRLERRPSGNRTRQGCALLFQLKSSILDVNVGQDAQLSNEALNLHIYRSQDCRRSSFALRQTENSIKLYLKSISAHPLPPVLNFITLKYRESSYQRRKSPSLPSRRSLKASLRKLLSINRNYWFAFFPRRQFSIGLCSTR